MQTDMHFYGTYAIARAAGLVQRDAFIVAYSAQFVDDSNQQDSNKHEDGGMIWGIATAHHPIRDVKQNLDLGEQRRVWVPFHFIPGGEGQALEEKLLCSKDSEIANQMISNHVDVAAGKKPFGFHLLGIAAHVYMDTFSHYGFSGISSEYNKVKQRTIDISGNKWTGTSTGGQDIGVYLADKCKSFYAKYVEGAVSELAALGHGGVATYPDRPFLHWRFEYEKDRPNNEAVADRNNPETYLEGCQKLHNYLSKFAKRYYASPEIKGFSSIEDTVKEVLNYQGDKQQRIDQWLQFIKEQYDEGTVSYSHEDWELQKGEAFDQLNSSTAGIATDIYRFYQAATYHRYYVLKDLLPEHGIMVY